MKTFLKIWVMLFLVSGFASCSSDDEFVPQSLEVTPNNISGVWKLAELNGNQVPDGVFCYIEFVRRDRSFTMYQKFDSMYPRCITGTYSIEIDEYKGAILSGKYDFGAGAWNNSYIVTGLFEEHMTLVVDADNGETCKYVRVAGVPQEILDRFSNEE